MGTPKAIILVGGEGTRLRPLTLQTHKSMVPILNRPFMEHLLDHLKMHGVSEAVLALCHLHSQIIDYFGDGSRFGMKVCYVVEDTPLGTAGAVKNAARYVDGTCFVLNGDIYNELDLTSMLDFHRSRGALATIALTHVEDVSAYGVVETVEAGRVIRFLEKPKPSETTARTVNAGTYILEPRALDPVPEGQFYMFEKGLFPTLVAGGAPVYGYPFSGYWMDIGTPQRYLSLNHHLLDLRREESSHGRGPGIWHSDGCEIHPTARITGPALLGEGCRVGASATIEGPTVLGHGCSVAAGARVTGSVLWSEVSVEAGARVEHSILARACRLGREAHAAPGCVLGDETAVSPGSRLEPGTLVWPSPNRCELP